MNQNELKIFAAQIRKAALRAMGSVSAGHVGGSMSMADLMAVLYGGTMRIDPKNPKWEERDWLVVSKGHCGPAVYGALALRGYFDEAELDTVNQGGTRLPSHCDMNLTPGIDMSTGSLGQGMSTAIGAGHGAIGIREETITFTWSSAMARPMKARSGKGPSSRLSRDWTISLPLSIITRNSWTAIQQISVTSATCGRNLRISAGTPESVTATTWKLSRKPSRRPKKLQESLMSSFCIR